MTIKVVEPNAENMNAIVDALRAITLVVTRQLPIDKQEDLRNDLMRLSREAVTHSNPLLEALLLDLHGVAGTASGVAI